MSVPWNTICVSPMYYYSFFVSFQQRFFNLQKIIAAAVLHIVAISPGPTTAVWLTLPYWLRYVMILTGISCRDEMLMIRNVHISSVAISGPRFREVPFCPQSSRLRSCNASIVFNPAGVAAQPSPKKTLQHIRRNVFVGGVLLRRSETGNAAPGAFSVKVPQWSPPFPQSASVPPRKRHHPIMVIQSVTASFAESSAAVVICGRVPWNAP